MKKVFEHIDKIKDKPHHIRKQIAYGVAGACTALIALIWLTSSIATGSFALKDNSFAQIRDSVTPIDSVDNIEQLAGAAAALRSNEPARIQIIDSKTNVMTEKKAEQTTIPF